MTLPFQTDGHSGEKADFPMPEEGPLGNCRPSESEPASSCCVNNPDDAGLFRSIRR